MVRLIAHDDGRRDEFLGTCEFRRSGKRLVQDEDGVLTPDGKGAAMKATRRYIWSVDGGRVDVAFGDMRPFHSVLLGVASHETTYLCPPDRYGVSYDFKSFPVWSTEWRVDGPRKAYVMTTEFQRL